MLFNKKKEQPESDESRMMGTEVENKDRDYAAVDETFDAAGDTGSDDLTDDAWMQTEKDEAKNIHKSGRRSIVLIVASAISVIAAVLLFVLMTQSWARTNEETFKALDSQYTKQKVYVASVEMSEYTEMTMENLLACTTAIEVLPSAVPDGAITERYQLLGLTTTHKIPAGAILTESAFEKYDNVIAEGYTEITISLGTLVNMAAGELVPGDNVTLSINDIEEGYTPFYDAVIYKLYDGAGVEQPSAKTASIMAIVVPNQDVAIIMDAINASQGALVLEKTY